MNVYWTQTARDDLQAIWNHIAHDSIFYADKFTNELFSSTDKLKTFPKSGRVVPEINDPNTREIIHGSYRIMYIIRRDEIYVTQVTHGSKQLFANNNNLSDDLES